MIVDMLQNWKYYFKEKPWEKAFEFILSLPENPEEGITKIQGEDIFARIMSYSTVTEDQAKLEAHDKYIDIQASLVNDERMIWFSTKDLKPVSEYNPDKDVIYYEYNAPAQGQITIAPGMFVIFFPEDAHMPKLITNSSHLMTKVVVKIHTKLL